MSATILVRSEKENGNILELVKSAVEAEIARLTLALEMAEKRLLPFEKNTTSTQHIPWRILRLKIRWMAAMSMSVGLVSINSNKAWEKNSATARDRVCSFVKHKHLHDQVVAAYAPTPEEALAEIFVRNKWVQ